MMFKTNEEFNSLEFDVGWMIAHFSKNRTKIIGMLLPPLLYDGYGALLEERFPDISFAPSAELGNGYVIVYSDGAIDKITHDRIGWNRGMDRIKNESAFQDLKKIVDEIVEFCAKNYPHKKVVILTLPANMYRGISPKTFQSIYWRDFGKVEFCKNEGSAIDVLVEFNDRSKVTLEYMSWR